MPAAVLTAKGRRTRAAIALLFEKFTTVFVGTTASAGPGAPGLELLDEDAITALSTVWKKILYGA